MLARRLVQLYAGLVLYGFSAGLILLAGLGADPWDVLHQGLARRSGLGTGWWVCIVGALVLLLWIPLRQRPGLGTASNVVVIGVAMEATFALIAPAQGAAPRVGFLAAGIVLNGVATGCYIGARFGPGPRDGLMTGLHRLTGRPVAAIRTGIELTALAVGVVLGGTFGPGTIAFALLIGPAVAVGLRLAGVGRVGAL
jgi:uncharacterized membrane protein YczE